MYIKIKKIKKIGIIQQNGNPEVCGTDVANFSSS